MSESTRWISRLVILLAIALGAGSILLFAAAPLGTLGTANPGLPEPALLAWDAALSVLFFLQHSGMVRQGFRRRLSRVVDPAYHMALYAIASGVALLGVTLLWLPSTVVVFALPGVWRSLAVLLSLAGVALFVWGARSLHAFDPLGIAPLRARLRGTAHEPCPFAARGAYARVRHPLYLGVILLIWARAEVTADHLLFAALWTAWIVAATVLEERDLAAELGEAYRAYQREVPMLLPLRRGEAYVALQLAIMALLAFGPRSWSGAPVWPEALVRSSSIAGATLLVAGAVLVVSGIVALGRNLSALPMPIDGATLIERGPYRLLRHPMYAGAMLMALGWGLWVHGLLTLGYAAVLLVFFDLKARREERWLSEKVAGYAEYTRRACRMIPFVY